jgi:hypothetical protein
MDWRVAVSNEGLSARSDEVRSWPVAGKAAYPAVRRELARIHAAQFWHIFPADGPDMTFDVECKSSFSPCSIPLVRCAHRCTEVANDKNSSAFD